MPCRQNLFDIRQIYRLSPEQYQQMVEQVGSLIPEKVNAIILCFNYQFNCLFSNLLGDLVDALPVKLVCVGI